MVFSFGRGGGIRTHGLLVPNQARYQTALHLDISYSILYYKVFGFAIKILPIAV